MLVNVILTVFLVIASTVLHEIGHAFFLNKHGIKISELGICLSLRSLIGKSPGKPLTSIAPRRIDAWGVHMDIPRIAFHAIPLGAYVDPIDEEDKFSTLSTSSKIEIYGAGSYVHLVLTALLYFTIFSLLGVYAALNGVYPPKEILIHALLGASVFALLVGFRDFVFRHGPIFLGALGIVLVLLIILTPEGRGSVGGVISVVAISTQTTSIFEVLIIALSVNLSMAIINAVPLKITDGAQILNALLGKANAPQRFQTSVGWVGAVALAALLFLSFHNDIINYIL